MKQRRKLLIALGAGALVNPPAAHAQSAARPPRVVLVLPGTQRNMAMRVDALQKRLRELGNVEGKNLILEIRDLDGQFEQLPALMAGIVQSGPTIILAQGSQSVRAAMQATSTIPIIAVTVGDPVEQGFAASLARPGGNITGNALIEEVGDQKNVEILHEMVPDAKRVAMLLDPANPGYERRKKRFLEAAARRGLTPQFVTASHLPDLPKAFADAVRQRAQMLVVANDAFFNANAKVMVDLAAQHHLPTIYAGDIFTPHGNLVSYSYSNTDLYRNTAVFIDRILKGRKPAELPFEQPTRFEMVLNLKTAKSLGLKIPQSVLIRADRVIE